MLNGDRLTPAWFAKSDVTMLVFYKQACQTCSWIVPLLHRFYQLQQPGQDWLVLVSQDPADMSEEWVTRIAPEIPVAIDYPDYRLSRLLAFTTVPAFFLIDSAGVIMRHSEGFVREELLKMVRTAVEQNRLADIPFYPVSDHIPLMKPG